MKKTLKKIKARSILLLPKDGFNSPPYTGVIFSVGPEVEDPDYKAGVRILFHDLAGFTIELDGQKIYSIREQDVAAIIEKKITII